MEDLEKRVVEFLVGQLKQPVSLKSTILEDLGCDGDDAAELLRHFAKEFEIDLTGLYEFWERHFNGGRPGWPDGPELAGPY